MIPTFAVVGHPNKGKSSIVATLAEDERLAIGPAPGTTRRAAAHTFSIDGQPQYVLVDTPGFQRAGAVLEWLEARATTASARAQLVADFVREHEGDPRFHDECELLRPIVDGAGILYVVDGSKPYGSEYELEMQIQVAIGDALRPRLMRTGLGFDYSTFPCAPALLPTTLIDVAWLQWWFASAMKGPRYVVCSQCDLLNLVVLCGSVNSYRCGACAKEARSIRSDLINRA